MRSVGTNEKRDSLCRHADMYAEASGYFFGRPRGWGDSLPNSCKPRPLPRGKRGGVARFYSRPLHR